MCLFRHKSHIILKHWFILVYHDLGGKKKTQTISQLQGSLVISCFLLVWILLQENCCTKSGARDSQT